MAFRLENWGVTYKECVHVILESQIGRNVEAYIDDIVVKSKKQGHLLDDLKEIFDNIHKYKMMLNPKKCVLVCHQGNCSAIWSCPEELMQTRRRWYPSNNCNHLETEKNPEAGRHDGITQPIHIQVGRTWYAILQATM
jgi:hypothetical protein